MNELIWWGRYGSYYEVLFLFCHRFGWAHTERFTVAFSKLVTAQSLMYERITESRKTFLHDLLKRFSLASVETADTIIRHIEELCAIRRNEVFTALNTHQFAGLSTKNLVCRLAAMFDEPYFPNGNADSLYELLIKTEIDIEHIEACNHKDETKRERIWTEWGPELHSLGNLIVLERSRNRGSEVSNHEYAVKRKAYRESKFAAVRAFAEEHENWNLEKAQARKRVLAERITNYLCGPSIPDSPNFPS